MKVKMNWNNKEHKKTPTCIWLVTRVVQNVHHRTNKWYAPLVGSISSYLQSNRSKI